MSKNYLKIQNVISEVNKVVVGQDYMIKRLLMGLFTQGHILLEGVPGVGDDRRERGHRGCRRGVV